MILMRRGFRCWDQQKCLSSSVQWLQGNSLPSWDIDKLIASSNAAQAIWYQSLLILYVRFTMLKHREEAECKSTILRLESVEQRIFDTISSHLGHEGMWDWGRKHSRCGDSSIQWDRGGVACQWTEAYCLKDLYSVSFLPTDMMSKCCKRAHVAILRALRVSKIRLFVQIR